MDAGQNEQPPMRSSDGNEEGSEFTIGADMSAFEGERWGGSPRGHPFLRAEVA